MDSRNMSSMEILVYYSKNRKNPPFEVVVRIDDKLTFVNCNCHLGVEHKFCRHVINAIRGDKSTSSHETNEKVIERLKRIFGPRSSLRIYMEDEWKKIREYSSEYPDDKHEIERKRLSLGTTIANGFINQFTNYENERFDIDSWENDRNILLIIEECRASIMYEDFNGEHTERIIDIKEIFEANGSYYIGGFCHLRNSERTFKVERVKRVDVINTTQRHKEKELLDTINNLIQ